IASSFSQLDIEIVRCGRIGLGAQLQMGLDRARSPYLARMDADDVTLPTRFEKQLRALKRDPQLSVVGTRYELLLGDRIGKSTNAPEQHQDIRRALLSGYPAFCHPTLMFRSDAARRCGYRISGIGEDLDFYLRMTEVGRGANLTEV